MNAHFSAAKLRPALKLWQILLMVYCALALVVFLALRAIDHAPKKPLTIDTANLSKAQIASLQTAVAPLGDVQFFGADLTSIQRNIAQLSWVESASVKRDWQKGVVVSVVPRRAVANFGSQHLLDASGKVFVPADEQELMNKSLVHLYSSHADNDAANMMKQMQQINEWFAPLGLTAQDLTLTSRKTWLIRFNNGLRVIVDHENTEQKLYSLSSILAGSLAKDLPKIQSVDLRYKNGFAIAWKNKAPTTAPSKDDKDKKA